MLQDNSVSMSDITKIKRVSQVIKNRPKLWIEKFSLNRKYGSSLAKASKIIWIDPNEITHKLIPFFNNSVPSNTYTYVVDGDWDKRYADDNLIYPIDYDGLPEERILVNIEDLDWFRSFESHFNSGISWEDTLLYQRRIEEDFNTSRYNSVDGLNKRLAYIDDLYEQIKSEGYKTQSALSKQGESHSRDWRHEVQINLGRTGEPILDDGRNRLILAKILGIGEIPVRVLVRHENWQRIRKQMNDSSIGSNVQNVQYSSHPDLQDIIEK